MKIFIAVPTFENISPETFKSIYGLDRAGQYLVFDFVKGYDCAEARNRIAKETLDENADYVLMVDSDIILPSDAVVSFLDDPKDICLGIYQSHENGKACVYEPGEYDYKTKFPLLDILNKRNNNEFKFEIHGGGMGCAFIKADIFRKLKYPYYKYINYDNGSVLSEDLYFCDQCKDNGIKIYADSRVRCGHIFKEPKWPF